MINAIDVPDRAIKALKIVCAEHPSMTGLEDALALLQLCQRITYFEIMPEPTRVVGLECKATPPASLPVEGKRA
jgi:hypothetical protein